MIYTVWYKCALCGDELAESRDVDAASADLAIWSVPPTVVHEACDGSPTQQGIGVAVQYRVVN